MSSRVRGLIFGASLLIAAFNNSWVAHFAWITLAILFALEFSYAIFSIFFFCSFFHPSGFFVDNPFLTLKHLHIAILFAAAIQILQGNFFRGLKTGFATSRSWALLFVLTVLAFLTTIWHGFPRKPFSQAMNFFSILLMFTYLRGLMIQYKNLLKPALLFFLSGIALQILIAFENFYTGHNWFDSIILHNNQLGVLSAISSFYALSFALSEKKMAAKIFCGLLTILLFLAVVFSCSRTAWFGFVFGYFFLILVRLFYASQRQIEAPRFQLILAALMLWFLFQWVAQTEPAIQDRATQVAGLKSANAWKYSFFIDRKNSGFLGSYRRDQLRLVKQIVKTDFWIGRGFTHEITDFHSLYLLFLAGTGIFGLSIFLLFCFCFCREIHQSLLLPTQEDFVFKLSSFTVVVTWLLISCLENRLLQYPVWTNLLVAQLWCLNLRPFN